MEEETISLKDIAEVLKKRFLLILVLMVGAAAISAGVTFYVMTPTYESSSQFLVKNNTESNSEFNSSDINTSLRLINTYNEIIKSPRILDEVNEELGLSISGSQLASKVNVSNAQDSQVVTVKVTDTDPNQAATIANTIVKVFQTEVPTLMNVDNVNILAEAEVGENPTPVSPNLLLNTMIALVLGAMVGVGLAFLLEYLDNTIKSETDVENQLALPVLGVVSHVKESDVASPLDARVKRSRRKGEKFDVPTTKKTV
nr:Wzz/FepE/Etk N-terminal domain-containing protein [Aquibacillus sediminis]